MWTCFGHLGAYRRTYRGGRDASAPGIGEPSAGRYSSGQRSSVTSETFPFFGQPSRADHFSRFCARAANDDARHRLLPSRTKPHRRLARGWARYSRPPPLAPFSRSFREPWELFGIGILKLTPVPPMFVKEACRTVTCFLIDRPIVVAIGRWPVALSEF